MQVISQFFRQLLVKYPLKLRQLLVKLRQLLVKYPYNLLKIN
jgi:hypothetical protein